MINKTLGIESDMSNNPTPEQKEDSESDEQEVTEGDSMDEPVTSTSAPSSESVGPQSDNLNPDTRSGAEPKYKADSSPGFTVHVAVQAYDYEIERGKSVLPPRKRILPTRFSDYDDVEDLAEDKDDEDYKPSPKTPTGRGRGRPRKVVRGTGDSEQTLNKKTDDFPVSIKPAKRGRKAKYKTFDIEELKETRSFRCTEVDCGQVFVSSNALQRHKQAKHITHDKESKEVIVKVEATESVSVKQALTCSQCDKSFSYPAALKNHQKIHSSDRDYTCDMCGNTFKTAESLKRHKMSHLGIKPFECDVCAQKFSSNVALREHKTRHSDSRPYECPTCQRRFRQVSVYKRHLLIHTGDKPHQCEICQMAFSQKVYLRSHMKKHTGEKPYKCDVCDKCFAHASDKIRHQKTHSGNKPYVCDVCFTRFTDPSSCRRHVKEHKNAQTFTCSHCGESFKRRLTLRSHIARRHESQASDKKVMPLQQVLTDSGLVLVTQLASNADLPPGTTVVAEQANSSSEQVMLLAPQDNQGTALSQDQLIKLEGQMASEALETPESHHVAYHFIQDDNHQQIVEIQYDTQAAVTENLEHVESVAATQDLVIEPTSTPDTEALQLDAIQNQSDESAVLQSISQSSPALSEAVRAEHVYAQPLSPLSVHPVSLSSVEQSSLQHLIDTKTVQGLQLATETQQQPPETSVAISQPHHSPDVDGLPATPITDPDQNLGAVEHQMDVLSSGQSMLTSQLTKQFVSSPDFSSQDYYNWLSAFTDQCKLATLPLSEDTFRDISQVQKSLADVMARPRGVLAHRDNFRILMSISGDLSAVIKQHLTDVLEQLDSQD